MFYSGRIFYEPAESVRFDCPNRTSTCAGTAAYTLVGIDLKLAVTGSNCTYRTLSFTGSAAYA